MTRPPLRAWFSAIAAPISPLVEGVLPLRCELAQGAREIRLAQPPAGLGDPSRGRELDPHRLFAQPRRQARCAQAFQHARVVGADRKALLRQADRRLHHARQRQRAPALLHQREAGHQTGRRHRQRTQQRGAFRHAGPQVHVAARRGRRRLARIHREDRAVGEPEQDEGASADPGRERLADAEGEAGRDRGVHRIAAGLQHLDTGARRVRLGRDDHPAARERGRGPGGPRGGRRQQRDGEEDEDGVRERSEAAPDLHAAQAITGPALDSLARAAYQAPLGGRMHRVCALAGLLLLLGAGGCDSEPSRPTPTVRTVSLAPGPHPVADLRVKDLGTIRIELLPEAAPKTVAQFEQLAGEGFYDGTSFHRVIPDFMIQGGCPNTRNADPRDDGTGGGERFLEDEFSDLPHRRGAVSMANRGSRNSGGTPVLHRAGRRLPSRRKAHGLRTRGRGDGGGGRDREARDRQVRPLRPARPPLSGLRGGGDDPRRGSVGQLVSAER